MDGETARHPSPPGEQAGEQPRELSSAAMLAGSLALLWSWFVVVLGLVMVLVVGPLTRVAERGYCENGDHPGPCSSLTEVVLPGLVLVAVGTWCVVATVAFRRGRPWARRAVVVTFALWAVGAVGVLAATLFASDGVDGRGVTTCIMLLAYFVGIVAVAAADG